MLSVIPEPSVEISSIVYPAEERAGLPTKKTVTIQ